MAAQSVRIAFRTLWWIARAGLVCVTLVLLLQNTLDLSHLFKRALKIQGATSICTSSAARSTVIHAFSTPAVQTALASAEPARFGTAWHRLPTQSKYAR